MKRVFVADSDPEDRSSLLLVLKAEVGVEVVGEADDWPTTCRQIPLVCPDILLIDRLVFSEATEAERDALHTACPTDLTVILTSRLSARQQVAASAGVDLFISKNEASDRFSVLLRSALDKFGSQTNGITANAGILYPPLKPTS